MTWRELRSVSVLSLHGDKADFVERCFLKGEEKEKENNYPKSLLEGRDFTIYQNSQQNLVDQEKAY